MNITKLNDRLSWIEPASMSNFSGCGGLFITGEIRIAIDTNFGTQTESWLAQAKPDLVIASHYHIDHVAALKHAEEGGISRLLMPAADLHMVSDPNNFHHLVDQQGELHTFWTDLLARSRFWPTREVTGFLAEDIADLGAGLVAVSTPGHSPGHTSFFLPDESILFTGDMGIDAFGPWYCWPDCDLQSMIASLVRLQELGAQTLLTSHGGMVTGATSCRAAFEKAINVVQQREEEIARLKQQGVSDEEIITKGILYPGRQNYKTEFRHIMGYWEAKTLQHHLAALQAGGLFSQSPFK